MKKLFDDTKGFFSETLASLELKYFLKGLPIKKFFPSEIPLKMKRGLRKISSGNQNRLDLFHLSRFFFSPKIGKRNFFDFVSKKNIQKDFLQKKKKKI